MTRAAFLRALPGHGFAPPEADAGALLPDDPAGCFAARVGEFAAGFWHLSPDARQAGWEALSAGAVGPAAARLADLGAGLDVVPVLQRNPDAAAVAALVRELFALPPRARAARRAAWLLDRAAGVPRWQAAGREVLLADPPLARLDPRLFDWLLGGAAPTPVAAAGWVPPRGVKAAGAWWSEVVWVLAALAAVAGSAALVVALAGHFARSRPRPAPPREPDPYSAPANAPFTAAEVRAFRAYDAGGRVGPSPYRWSDWVRAGRPPAGGEP